MKRAMFTLLLLLVTMTIGAIPAKQGVWKTITLDDGRNVRAVLRGDEFEHHWFTADGRRFVAAEGRYQPVSAEMRQVAEGRRAQIQQHRALRLPQNRTARGAAYTGQKKGVMILVNFNDVKFQPTNDVTFYEHIANTPGYTDAQGFVGSVFDYFNDQSRGQFELTFDIVGPVTLSRPMAYYGENDSEGRDMHVDEMVIEAVNLATEQVNDWRPYDWDSDGEVDQVMIIYAGESEAAGGDPETIWPCESVLAPQSVIVSGGLKVNTYAVANECTKETNKIGKEHFIASGIGPICHEYCHCLGVPDMYDTKGNGSYGMGTWSVMDVGVYNGNGFVPANFTSYEKICIGWLTPAELTSAPFDGTLRPLNDVDDVYLIRNEGHQDEYYLLENRQRKGWDRYVPAQGMLVLHVDYDATVWSENMVNTVKASRGSKYNHQHCTIFHADGVDKTAERNERLKEIQDSLTMAVGATYNRLYAEYKELYAQNEADIAGDVYPQPDNNQLTNVSTPRAFTYHPNSDGRLLMNCAITDITQQPDGTITFRYTPDQSGTEEGDNTVYGQTKGQDETSKDLPEGVWFLETFDLCDGVGGNDGIWNGSLVGNGVFQADYEHWFVTTGKGSGANQCAFLSAASMTPEFQMGGTGQIIIRAGVYDAEDEGTRLMVVPVKGTISTKLFELPKGRFETLTATLSPDAEGNAVISFSCTGRYFIDEIKVVAEGYSDDIHEAFVNSQQEKSKYIYDLTGRKIANESMVNGLLPKGIYIINGRKVMK